MRNTGCLPSCEAAELSGQTPQLRRISIMGCELEAKGYLCTADGVQYPDKGPETRLQLTICPTSRCDCRCPFCIAENTEEDVRPDPAKLENVLLYLRDRKLVRGVSFTGGEPFLDPGFLDELVSLVFSVFGPHMEVSISTNGSHITELGRIRELSRIDAIHISRHHDDDRINRRLFGGGSVPDAAVLKKAIAEVPWKDLFVFNCLLLKDGIGTVEDVHRYLAFAADMGVPKTAFITGMPANAWVQEQTMDYREVLRRDDPSLLFTRGFRDHTWCRCQDGIFVTEDNRLVEFYGRSTDTSGCPYVRGLVYTADDHLRSGFGGKVIV